MEIVLEALYKTLATWSFTKSSVSVKRHGTCKRGILGKNVTSDKVNNF
jgi:hypothetical protein